MEETDYTLSNGTLTIHEGVKKIPTDAFKDRSDFEIVIFPNSLRVIGKRAFCACINLNYVKTNKKLKVIDLGAFQNCFRLVYCDIPKNVYYIGRSAFNCCYKLESSIVIPQKIKILEESVFLTVKAYHLLNTLQNY